MLVNLFIKNFILIKEINLDLSDSFNVFTGETGAGKSLFVDALNFVSGERSSAGVVGKDGDTAYVEAVFTFNKKHKVIQELIHLDLYQDTDDVVVFSREMNSNGRSVSRINRRIVNLSTIKDVLSHALDIHSQHETQYLLNEKNHLILLDSFIHKNTLLDDYKSTYTVYLNKLKEIEALKNNKLDEDELGFAKFILKEIEALNPSLEDYQKIDAALKEMENYERNKSNLDKIENTLVRDTDVLGHLYGLMHYFETLNDLNEQFTDVYYQLEDISQEIARLNSAFVFNEFEYASLNERMIQYMKLIRKYGSIESLLSKKEELETHIRNADYFEDVMVDLLNELDIIKQALTLKSNALSTERKRGALELESKILNELSDLMLENAVFKVSFEDKAFSINGADDVKFLISLNKGIDISSLSKVASGGELSRVMLGLKVIFSDVQGISTLIFDEIDTGVSGRVAFKIGEKMKAISKVSQVISITHLATVAACAKNHYLISKKETENTTITHVEKIEDQERIKQLALMMSGVINVDSIKAAEKVLEQGVQL